jgi:4-aminobutyrate aminotransferase-like enzyme
LPTALPEPGSSTSPLAPMMSTSVVTEGLLDWASSIQAPLGQRHPRLVRVLEEGGFTGAVGTKLTLSNWVTPAIVRYCEVLMHLGPKGLPHVYFTSSRDEMIDKALRLLRVKRPGADIVVGLERAYVGHTTAATRSLSDPAGEQLPFAWFDWPRVPHPAEAGTDATIGAIMAVLNRAGPEKVLGIVVETMGERSGLALPDDFQSELQAIHHDTGVPIIAVETASALGRTGANLWANDGEPLKPNVILWYAGGQLGHVFVDDKHYVGKPLTLISTWDGDEISMLRAHHHLLEARHLLKESRGAAFQRALDDKKLPGKRLGAGLWQVLDVGDELKADAVRKAALRRGVRLGKGFPGRVLLVPPLCVNDAEIVSGIARVEQAIREVL